MDKKITIRISKKIRKRLRKLGVAKESDNTIIKRMIDYIEFHPEYWSRQI